MPTVKFVKENVVIEVPEGANLRREALRAGIPLNRGFLNGFGRRLNQTIFNCHGMGTCGTWRVLITKGAENVNQPTLKEKLQFKTVVMPDPIPKFAYVQYGEQLRLACQVKVFGDIEVEADPPIDLFGEKFYA